MKPLLSQFGANLKTFFAALPDYFRREFIWWLALIPIPFLALIYVLADVDFRQWRGTGAMKRVLEIAQPSLLGTGVLLGLFAWAVTRDTSLALLAVICALSLGGESAGRGAMPILILGLVACIVYGATHRPRISTFLESRRVKALVAICFLCYVVSQITDLSMSTPLRPFVLSTVPYVSYIEESLETFGAVFLLAATIACVIAARRRISRTRHGEFS